VEPRGFEPLTSAVQRRRERFVTVGNRSENRLYKPNYLIQRLTLFVTIRPGNCQVTVNFEKCSTTDSQEPCVLLTLSLYTFYVEEGNAFS
jgi:hypothetical protein